MAEINKRKNNYFEKIIRGARGSSGLTLGINLEDFKKQLESLNEDETEYYIYKEGLHDQILMPLETLNSETASKARPGMNGLLQVVGESEVMTETSIERFYQRLKAVQDKQEGCDERLKLLAADLSITLQVAELSFQDIILDNLYGQNQTEALEAAEFIKIKLIDQMPTFLFTEDLRQKFVMEKQSFEEDAKNPNSTDEDLKFLQEDLDHLNEELTSAYKSQQDLYSWILTPLEAESFDEKGRDYAPHMRTLVGVVGDIMPPVLTENLRDRLRAIRDQTDKEVSTSGESELAGHLIEILDAATAHQPVQTLRKGLLFDSVEGGPQP